jgi:hypothetical protein
MSYQTLSSTVKFSPPPPKHSRSFSLQAFQSLWTAQASFIRQYVSRHPCTPKFGNSDSAPLLSRRYTLSTEGAENRRSIVAESDCDEELYPDEGWIPIAWDESLPVLQSPLSREPRHKQWNSVSSTSTIKSRLSLFSQSNSEEWTPPSTPASPLFADVPFRSGMRFDKFASSCRTAGGNDDTMRWLMCEE